MPQNPPRLVRTRTLVRHGWTEREIRAAVGEGRLERLRGGAFCDPGIDAEYKRAGRLRGRLACVSELQRLGVFVLVSSSTHVHIERTAARLPVPGPSHRVHRRRLIRTPHPDDLSVGLLDAVFDAVLCQPPRAAVATIDSALHRGLLHADDLEELFVKVPMRLRHLRGLIDSRAESGPETLMRLILRSMPCSFVPQAQIQGVGRVDFVVDGWLVIECDSEEHHGGWKRQMSDRRRDLAAAALGMVTLRPTAEDIMWHRDAVRAAVAGLLASRPRRRPSSVAKAG